MYGDTLADLVAHEDLVEAVDSERDGQLEHVAPAEAVELRPKLVKPLHKHVPTICMHTNNYMESPDTQMSVFWQTI